MEATAKLNRVIEYIDAHLTEDMSMTALAAVAGYSPWHLSRVFLDGTGMPVMEYVRVRRLLRAVDELAHGRRLHDIALDYGFETQAGFYKAFRRQFGCSPSRFRTHKLREVHRRIDPALLRVAGEGGNMQDCALIRVVEEQDAEDLWENVFSRNTLNEVRERIANAMQAYAGKKAVPLVAEVEGHVIGTTYMRYYDDLHHVCTLFDVVVNPGFQRRGIARRLIEECKTRAVADQKCMMFTSTLEGNPAETFYQKIGFIEYGRVTHTGSEQTRVEIMFYLLPGQGQLHRQENAP